ncbi:MAG: HAMP domain-containing histidine kinase [Clostridiales bacterium]|nr:HAMP domain-containing histidine kinase [Clostridiales bacterium]
MANNHKSSERQLKGFLLSRFFLILAVVSIVELIVVALTNAYLIPSLVMITNYDKVILIDGAEGLFIVVFVLIATWAGNKILPFFRISPVDVNSFLEKILARRGFANLDTAEATETLRAISQEPKAVIPIVLSGVLVAFVLILPYVVGGVIFSLSVARGIRRLQREKEAARIKDEKRRYLMISNIVHDLKTPMTTVYGYAKALNDGLVPLEKQAEYHEAIMAKTDRMNEVVALLLDYVKLDSEGFAIKKVRLDICELVRSCCAFCFTDIESAGDEIDVCIPERSIYINADSMQLSRVITNLITNAIRHNPKGTKIKVSVTSDSLSTADDVRIFVADTGDEIPAPLNEQIFEPFVTGDESRASGSGTGLGLALSTRICDMHGFKLKLVQKPEIHRYRLGEEYQKVFVIAM